MLCPAPWGGALTCMYAEVATLLRFHKTLERLERLTVCLTI